MIVSQYLNKGKSIWKFGKQIIFIGIKNGNLSLLMRLGNSLKNDFRNNQLIFVLF